MDFKYLEYAIAVAECKTITKAAQKLYIAQPNLSRALRDLEQELGFSLFVRTKKGMTPTAAGERFLTEAKGLLERLEALARECRETSGQQFLFSCVPSSLLLNTVLDVANDNPGFQLESKEYPSDLFLETLTSETADAGLIILALPIKEQLLKFLDRQGLCYHSTAQSPLIQIIKQSSPLLRNLQENGKSPWIDISQAEVLINISYYESIGIKLESLPYPVPGRSHRRGSSRAANVDMVDAIPDLVMLSCCFHPRILERNQLIQLPYRPDIPLYEYGYVLKKDKAVSPGLLLILSQIEDKMREYIIPPEVEQP